MGVHIADVSHFVRQVRARQTLSVSHAAQQKIAQDLHNTAEAACLFSSPAVCLAPSCLPILFPHRPPVSRSQHRCGR